MFKRLFISVMPFVLLVSIIQFCLGRNLNEVNWMTIWTDLQNCFKFDLLEVMRPFVERMSVNYSILFDTGSFWEKVGAFFSLVGQGLVVPFYTVYALIVSIGQWFYNVGIFVGIWG